MPFVRLIAVCLLVFVLCPTASAGERAVELLNEDFEGIWPPTGWSQLIGEPEHTWDRTTLRSHSGEASVWVNYGPQGVLVDEWLITPPLDFSDRFRIFLEFYEDQRYWPVYGGTHAIYLCKTTPSHPDSFKLVQSWTPVEHSIPGFDGLPTHVDLSAYAGPPVVYLAFRYTGIWADDWFIDDVHVYSPGQRDAAVLAIHPDGEQYEGGETITPQVTVTNNGGQTVDFAVNFYVDRSGEPIVTEKLFTTLAPAAIDTLDFSPLLINPGHYYQLMASTNLNGDHVPVNDSTAVFVDSYTQVRRPLAWLHTNTGSNPSALAELKLDSLVTAQPDSFSLLRLHTWWPGADPFYDANPLQSDSLIAYQGIDFVPHLWVDGLLDLRTHVEDYPAGILSSATRRSPLSIETAWNPEAEQAEVWITRCDPLPPGGDYHLYLAIIEDGIDFVAANGLVRHNQVFRRMFPTTEGLPIPSEPGVSVFDLEALLDPSWNGDSLGLLAYIRDDESGIILQSRTGRLAAQSSLVRVVPRVTQVELGESFMLPLVIRPGGVTVGALGFALTYESTIMALDSIVPGTWLSGSGTEFLFTDGSTPGEVRLNVTIAGGLGGITDTLAVCHFSGTSHGETALLFDSLGVIAPGGEALPFRHSHGDSVRVRDPLTPVSQAPPPTMFLSAYPNPFNPTTTLHFALESPAVVLLDLYDVSGRRLRRLVTGRFEAGEHALTWDGRDERGHELPSGIYLARIAIEDNVSSTKLVLLR